MKILRGKKLRVNIFIAFLSILTFSETVIFGFFYLIDNQRHENSIQEIVRTTGLLFKELIRTYFTTIENKQKAIHTSSALKLIALIQKANPAITKMWIEDRHGRVLIKPFKDPIPTGKFRFFTAIEQMAVFKGENPDGHEIHFLKIPITLNDGSVIITKIIARSLYRLNRKDILFLLILLGVTIAIGPIALYVSRSITRPLRDLTETAHRASLGDLSVRAPIRTRDEIGELGIVFNDMLDMVEKMIHSTRELATNVSHELRTPLTRILISRELLEDNLDRYKPEFFAKHLNLIRKDIEKLDLMIARILHLSRLEIQPGMEAPERIPLDEIFTSILDAFGGVLQDGRFTFKMQCEEGLVVTGIRQDFLTALSNLIENAIKYTPRQGYIFLKTEKIDEEAVIAIHNSTPDPQELPDDPGRLFEPFFRAKSRTRRGSGLGMAISARIIRSMEGDISASVAEGQFEVTIRLPMGI